MNTTTGILNLEMRDINPWGSRRHYMPRRLSLLETRDGDIYRAFPSSAKAQLPRIVNRRFLSGSRTARTVSTYFNDDFSLNILDSVWGCDHLEVVGNDNEWYVLSLRLSGDTLESVGGHDYRLSPYSCYLVHYTRGMNYVLRSVSEQPLIEACTTFRPAMLAGKLGISRDELDRVLHLGSYAANPWFSQCHMTAEMERIVRELRSCCLTESGYRLHAEAKTLELIFLYLAQLQAQAKTDGQRILSTTVHCLQRVKRYLEENYDQAPNIDQLCRMVGFNRRKLTASFKREFGKTICEYHQEVRMEIAKTMFRGQTGNVSLVAQKIGYSFPGNFAKAFQKYAGVTPKAYVKCHAKEFQ